MKAELVKGGDTGKQVGVLLVGTDPIRLGEMGLGPLIEGESDLLIVDTVDDPSRAVEISRATRPDVIVVGLPFRAGPDTVYLVTQPPNQARVIALVPAGETEYEEVAYRAGADVYLRQPVTPSGLLVTIRRLARQQAPTAAEEQPQPEAEGPSIVLRPAEEPAVETAAPRAANVTMVLGGKGGVGKTTIAIGLASVLTRIAPGRVALVDLDLQFGDVALMLGASPDRGMADVSALVTEDGAINSMTVGSFMPEHAGVRLLCAPSAPEQADIIAPDHVRAALEAVRYAFEYIVIDGSAHFSDEILEAVDFAEHVILVSDLSIGSIKETLLCFNLLPLLGVPREKLQLVLNRIDGPASNAVEEVEVHLQCTAAALIPQRDDQALEAVTHRIPITEVNPGSLLSRRIAELASMLVGRRIQLTEERDAAPKRIGIPIFGRR